MKSQRTTLNGIKIGSDGASEKLNDKLVFVSVSNKGINDFD
jgi:hypothetical protein